VSLRSSHLKIGAMRTGQTFRLNLETFGVESLPENEQVTVRIPAGSVVSVLSGPHEIDNRMVEVRWAGRKLMMFLEDLESRSDLVSH